MPALFPFVVRQTEEKLPLHHSGASEGAKNRRLGQTRSPNTASGEPPNYVKSDLIHLVYNNFFSIFWGPILFVGWGPQFL